MTTIDLKATQVFKPTTDGTIKSLDASIWFDLSRTSLSGLTIYARRKKCLPTASHTDPIFQPSDSGLIYVWLDGYMHSFKDYDYVSSWSRVKQHQIAKSAFDAVRIQPIADPDGIFSKKRYDSYDRTAIVTKDGQPQTMFVYAKHDGVGTYYKVVIGDGKPMYLTAKQVGFLRMKKAVDMYSDFVGSRYRLGVGSSGVPTVRQWIAKKSGIDSPIRKYYRAHYRPRRRSRTAI